MAESYRELQKRAKKAGIPANQSREDLEAALADAPEADSAPNGVRVEFGPKPLRANEQLTITVSGLPALETARLSVRPGVSRHQSRTDRWGELQTVIFPDAGRHTLVVEVAGETIQRDFDVAEQ